MTQTIQSRSLAALNKAEKNLAITKRDKEENARLLLEVYDNLNELYDKLNKLNNIIGRSRR